MDQVQPMGRLEHAVRMDWTRPLLLNHEDGSWMLRCVTRVNYFLRNCNDREKVRSEEIRPRMRTRTVEYCVDDSRAVHWDGHYSFDSLPDANCEYRGFALNC